MKKSIANNVKSKPQKRIADDDKIALCKRWKASRLSAELFCKEHGIARSSFHKWYKKFRADVDVEPNSDFFRVTPRIKQQSAQEKGLMELRLANGTILQLNLSLADTVNLIQELNHAATVVR